MGADYDKVVAALPRLSPEERGRIAERIKMMQALAPTKSLAAATGAFREAGVEDDAAGELLCAISEVVLRASGERVAPATLRRSRQYQSVAAKAGALEAFLSRQVRSRTARRALLAIGVELLYKDLQQAEFAVSARTLMACAHQLPAVLDKAFPGYAAAGLLGMIVGNRLAGGPRAGGLTEV